VCCTRSRRRQGDCHDHDAAGAAVRGQAIALGDKVGKDEKAVTAEFKNEDTDYVHKFYIVGQDGSLTPSSYAASEVLYCNLTPLLQQ